MRKARGDGSNAAVQRGEIDGAILRASGGQRRGRFVEVDGIDLIERQPRSDGVLQRERISPVAGGNRFQRHRMMAETHPAANEPAGEPSLADPGVGAGDKKTGNGEART
jgi:hypothetical protein